MDVKQQCKDIVFGSHKVVFFGGAGVSTESNIPDFRGQNGLFQNKDLPYAAEELLSHSFFLKRPQLFFDYYRHTMIHPHALPNPTHRALAVLEQLGIIHAVVTQNIDGLHQMAGSERVFELHGSVHRNHCLTCQTNYDLASMIGLMDNAQDGVPYCPCGGVVKPDVVLYEEALNQSILNQAIAAIAEADVLIVAGTSLRVYPAASLLHYFSGRHLILINQEPTPSDHIADVLIREPVGEVFAWLMQQI